MFPSLLESFGKISMGSSQDKISEKLSSRSSTDTSSRMVAGAAACIVTQLPSWLKCLIKARLNIALS